MLAEVDQREAEQRRVGGADRTGQRSRLSQEDRNPGVQRFRTGWRSVEGGPAWLLDLVGAVESGACDDMSGHGIECIGEGELVGQVELTVQGEELEDVGVWSV
jgi:hypothetical protein